MLWGRLALLGACGGTGQFLFPGFFLSRPQDQPLVLTRADRRSRISIRIQGLYAQNGWLNSVLCLSALSPELPCVYAFSTPSSCSLDDALADEVDLDLGEVPARRLSLSGHHYQVITEPHREALFVEHSAHCASNITQICFFVKPLYLYP